MPGLDGQLFFERVLLNFLVGNGDAHLKNFSMLETATGALRLSPAYDILCSKAVIPRETDSALTLNGKANHLRRGDFERFAESLQIPPKALAGIWAHFQAGQSMMLDAVPRSRLSPELQESLRKVIQERQQRLFGHVAMG